MAPFKESSSLGKYQALSEQEQDHDTEHIGDTRPSPVERRQANQKSAGVWIQFLYYFLSAFGGFIFAIALVNFYPGAIGDVGEGGVGSGYGNSGNLRLKALLSGMFF